MSIINYDLLLMEITAERNGFYSILISKNQENCEIEFSPDEKQISYKGRNNLITYLKLREFQLRKLLHNKTKESFYVGFKLNFVLHDGSPDANFYDKSKITILNNIHNQYLVTKSSKKSKNIPELFTDGSFNQIKKTGGYAILIKKNGEYFLNQVKTDASNSNLIELLAVLKGLEYLKAEQRIRIITDSQYVIKGLTEWLPLWKINDFYTANGTKAKNIETWKKADNLLKEKYIEFEWVKSHSDHFENTICHIKAKSINNK